MKYPRVTTFKLFSLAIILLFANCASTDSQIGPGDRMLSENAPGDVPTYTFKVVNSWEHDADAYTQGLIYADGILYESTGRYGQSSLRKVELTTGRVLKKVDVDQQYFAEGMTLFQGKIFQLTWKAQKGFIYDTDFNRTGEFAYEGEGWGLTHDAESLIMSDGTNQIRFLDPHTFKVQRAISVMDNGKPLLELNELEYIRGEIFANIWQTNRIVRIDPHDGKILGWVDMTGLLKLKDDYDKPVDVLNGIAYDEGGDRLFVTGKLWPKLFEIRLKKK